MKHTTPVYLVLVLICLSILVSSPSSVAAQETPGTPPPGGTPEPAVSADQAQDILREAEHAQDQAQQAISTIDEMLSFLEVAGIVLTVFASLVALTSILVGVGTIRDLRHELEEVRGLRTELATVPEQMNTMKVQKVDIENIAQRLQRELDHLETQKQSFEKLRHEIHEESESYFERSNKTAQALALGQLAEHQISLGNLSAAVDSLREAARFDPDNRVIQFLLGDLQLRLGQLDDGYDRLEKIVEGDYKLLAAEASFAYALRLKGDRAPEGSAERERYYARAIDLFLKVYEERKELVDITGESVFGALAGLYRRQGRYNDALYYYEHARQVTPGNSYPYNNLGLLHYFLGNRDEALANYTEAREIASARVKLARSDYWAWFDLISAQIILGLDPPEEIQGNIQRVLELTDTAGLLEKPLVYPLKSFLSGLDSLRNSASFGPPPNIDEYIQPVKEKYEQWEKAAGQAQNVDQSPRP